jgi:hypothetical protein
MELKKALFRAGVLAVVVGLIATPLALATGKLTSTHPLDQGRHNETPKPLYADNAGVGYGQLLSKEQAIAKVISTATSYTKEAVLETWAEHVVKDEPNDNIINFEVAPGRKVWVVKTAFPDGLNTKTGFFNHAVLTSVFDAQTGTLLESSVTGNLQGWGLSRSETKP